MGIKKIIIGLTPSLLLASGVAVAADFNKGFKAYQSGDFKTALAEWSPLAELGHANAQNNLGAMYDNGHSVPENDKTAVKWYTEAAKQGDSYAQNQMIVTESKSSLLWLWEPVTRIKPLRHLTKKVSIENYSSKRTTLFYSIRLAATR